jgi:hypothetical protein
MYSDQPGICLPDGPDAGIVSALETRHASTTSFA